MKSIFVVAVAAAMVSCLPPPLSPLPPPPNKIKGSIGDAASATPRFVEKLRTMMETIEASVLKFKTVERTTFDELAEAEAQLSKQVAVHVRVMCLFSLLGFFFFGVGCVDGHSKSNTVLQFYSC